MPKSVKIAVIVCLSVAAVPAVVFGSLTAWLWYKTAQVESFYQQHRLLQDMRAVERQGTNDSGPAREALLRFVPVGMDKERALAVLRREGLGCRTIAEPVGSTRLRQRLLETGGSPKRLDDNQTRKTWVDCQVLIPTVLGYVRWIVDLEFDADDHLGDVRVADWNIFL